MPLDVPLDMPLDENAQFELLNLRAIVNSIGAHIYAKDLEGRYTYVNQQVCRLFGLPREEILGHDDHDFFDLREAKDLERFDRRVLDGGETIECEERNVIRQTGEARYFNTVKTPVRNADGVIIGMCGISTDITEKKKLEMELERQAHIDFLTNLSNRRHFIELAEHEVSRALRYQHPVCLLMLDVDHFKRVNDTYGHKQGDKVLSVLAQTCVDTLRDSDVAGRLGGEEFAFLLPETGREQGLEVAERLRKVLAETAVATDNEGESVHFSVSIGMCLLCSDCDTVDTLLNCADKALYRAKESGRNRVCVS